MPPADIEHALVRIWAAALVADIRLGTSETGRRPPRPCSRSKRARRISTGLLDCGSRRIGGGPPRASTPHQRPPTTHKRRGPSACYRERGAINLRLLEGRHDALHHTSASAPPANTGGADLRAGTR